MWIFRGGMGAGVKERARCQSKGPGIGRSCSCATASRPGKIGRAVCADNSGGGVAGHAACRGGVATLVGDTAIGEPAPITLPVRSGRSGGDCGQFSGLDDEAENHRHDLVAQPGLFAVSLHGTLKDATERGAVGDIEEAERADVPVQVERLDSLTEDACFHAALVDALEIVDGGGIELLNGHRALEEHAVMDVLDHHHANEIRMTVVVLEGEFDQAAQCVSGAEVIKVELDLAAAHHAVGLFQTTQVQAVLVVEIIVDHALGGIGLGGDLVDPGTGQTIVCKFAHGDFNDVAFGPFWVLCTGFGGRLFPGFTNDFAHEAHHKLPPRRNAVD